MNCRNGTIIAIVISLVVSIVIFLAGGGPMTDRDRAALSMLGRDLDRKSQWYDNERRHRETMMHLDQIGRR